MCIVCLLQAQPVSQIRCLFDEAYDQQLEDSLNKIFIELLNIEIFNNQTNGNPSTRNIYEIPVVVHIVSPPGTPVGQGNNLTDQDILYGLELLNAAFANEGVLYSAKGNNSSIRFCLARRTPDGQPTNGITRTYSNLVAGASCTPFSTNFSDTKDIKALINWDCSQYMNIWLVTDLYDALFGCSLAGFATFPGGQCFADGIMQESRYWNTTQGVGVTAHEVGHYLGLHHTFRNGCINNDCNFDGDLVCDTPPDSSNPFANCDVNSCSTEIPDLIDDSYNFMDYSNCAPHHFTQGQVNRMRATIELARYSLIESMACLPLADRDIAIIRKTINGPNCKNELCNEINVANLGKDEITSFQIYLRINGINQLIYSWNGVLLPNQSINISLPCIPLDEGQNELSYYIDYPNGLSDEYIHNNLYEIGTFTLNAELKVSTSLLDSTYCGENGSIHLNASGGTAPYEYSLNNSIFDTKGKYNWLSGQNHVAVIQDANNCTDTLNITLPDTCPPCLSGIINIYSPVLSFCDEGNVEVSSSSEFNPDDKILIYQAKGAELITTLNPNFGNIADLGQAGIFEFNRIKTINGNTLTLYYETIHPYEINNLVQIVSVPDIGDETICNLTCKPWDGSSGGILVFDGGEIEMVGNINTTGMGFSGGQHVFFFSTFEKSYTNYTGISEDDGGMKGESIAHTLPAFQLCKGKWASGGGGGNNHNAGGGGGAGGGNGGFGGTHNSYSQDTRGIGGIATTHPDKLYLGGGGGAGHDNNNWGSGGGHGGGIVMINADALNSSNPVLINSGGMDGMLGGIDGAGGGGGGGTLWLKCNFISSNIVLSAEGGNGGNNNSAPNFAECVGTGGGGGGGRILTEYDNNNYSTQGGQSGKRINQPTHPPCLNKPITNFATDGDNGKVEYTLPNYVANIPYDLPYIESIAIESLCDSTSITFTIGNEKGGTEISANGSDFKSGHSITIFNSSSNFFTIRNNCIEIDTILKFEVKSPLELVNTFSKGVLCDSVLGSIIVDAIGGVPPYQFQIDNSSLQQAGVFENLQPGTYLIGVYDSNGCRDSLEIDILDLSTNFKLIVDSVKLIIECEIPAYIAVSNLEGLNNVIYILNDSIVSDDGFFQILSSGNYTVTAFHEFGCNADTLMFNITFDENTLLDSFFIEICYGDSIGIGESIYTETGIYIDSLYTITGCDSIIYTNLEVKNGSLSINDINICFGDSVIVGNSVYKNTGTYFDSFISANGCDSTIVTTLMVNSENYTQIEDEICFGESIQIGGEQYTTSGIFSNTLSSSSGCDSIILLNLKVQNEDPIFINYTLCFGDSLLFDNQIIKSNGTYIDTLSSTIGCDSIVIATIYFNDTFFIEQTIILCYGDSIQVGSSTYTTEGIFIDTLITNNGCDSIIQTSISVENENIIILEYNICRGDTIYVLDTIFTKSGYYSWTISSSQHCDSTVIVNINPLEESYCDSLYCRLYIPNAFSPNFDGINDIFTPYSNVIQIEKLEIYSRWGELLYSQYGNEVSWDGTHKGRIMDPGVYVYLIYGICRNGTKILKGDINLIR